MMQLAEILLFEADRKSLHRLRRFLRHQRYDRARIDAARKKCAQWHFGHQPHPHGFAEQLDDPLAGFLLANINLV